MGAPRVFFRNLTLFRIPATFAGLFDTPVADELGRLGAALSECALKPVGPMELVSRGFVSPLGRDSEQYAHQVGEAVWIAVGTEEKLLPAAVINDLLQKKLDEFEEREGHRPGGRARKRLKEELVTELLPRAFVQPGRTDAYFDLVRGFVAVDTSSRRRGEEVVVEVRRALGSFPALPLNAETAPRAVLTGWLAGDELPEGLSLGDECELRSSDDEAVVKVQRLDLHSEEVVKHLEAGMQCTRLALVYQDHVSFVLGEDLTLRKVKFLDGAVDQLENTERDDIAAELDARFALMAGEVGALFDLLEAALKISRPAGDAPGAAAPQRRERRAGAAADRLRGMAREDGITSITISSPGAGSVTIAPGQLQRLGAALADYNKAVELVRSSGKVSISYLQRQMRLGYNRAARLIEAMEERGIVSPPSPDGSRTLLSPTKEPA